jgi:hypothetical protein
MIKIEGFANRSSKMSTPTENKHWDGDYEVKLSVAINAIVLRTDL